MRGSVNIALIKYWGKRDDNLNVPLNDSLSLTLHSEHVYTDTRIEESDKDELILNGQPASMARLEKILMHLRKECNIPPIKIISENSFPTAAGMASSASGMAAFCLTLNQHFNLQLSPEDLSRLARLGSGSACRSLFDGLVWWHAGHDHESSYAEQVFPPSHWPSLRGVLVQVSKHAKMHGSREGMRMSRDTSLLLQERVLHVPDRVKSLMAAFGKRDFSAFAELVMRDSNQFHAICMDTWPPLHYLNGDSWDLMHLVVGQLKGVAAYTFDAGPNALVLYEQPHDEQVMHAIRTALPHATLIPVTLSK